MSAHGTFPRRGLGGELVHRLALQILAGELEPGEVLPVEGEELAGLVVSRSVSREAFKVLTAKGLMESRQSIGTRVRAPGHWNLLDPDILSWLGEIPPQPALLSGLTELRLGIEPLAARLTAGRATDEQRAAIASHYAEMAANVKHADAFADADVRFHSAILEASHNAFLVQFNAGVATALRSTRHWLAGEWASRHGTAGLEATLPPHKAVLTAIRKGNGPRAEAAMRKIVETAIDDLASVLSQQGERRKPRERDGD